MLDAGQKPGPSPGPRGYPSPEGVTPHGLTGGPGAAVPFGGQPVLLGAEPKRRWPRMSHYLRGPAHPHRFGPRLGRVRGGATRLRVRCPAKKLVEN